MNAISGLVKVTAVEGNRQKLDGGSMFGNAPKALWQRWYQPDELGRIELSCRGLLIEIEDQLRILCETGIGCFFEPKLAERYGVFEREHQLLNNLAGLGVKPEDIDVVILSHLHFDHAGGLLPSYEEIQQGNDGLVFPNAQFVVGREAFARSKHPHVRDRASFISGLAEKLERSGRLRLIDGDRVAGMLEDHLRFRYSSGHTPGQMHTVFSYGNSSIFFAGDLIPGLAWVNLPITMGYDRFPEKLIDEKSELYETAVSEQWVIFYTHDIHACASTIKKTDKGKFEPDRVWERWQRFQLES